MAWNEPGGNGEDPWGNKGGNQGPQDFDEAYKNFQKKMNGLFGDGGSQGGGFNPRILVMGIIALALVWGASGFYQLDQKEEAVVLRFGEFHEIKTAGLHWNPKGVDAVIRHDVTGIRTINTSGEMLTQDENIVKVDLSVQYNIKTVKDYSLNVRLPEDSLRQSTDSALRHVVGSSTMDEVITDGRAQLATETKQRLQDLMDDYGTGIFIVQVNVQNAAAPRQVQAAFDDVVKAREDQQRSSNEAQAYANAVVPEARGRAQRMIEESVAYRDQVVARSTGEADRFSALLVEYEKSPQVTRERLYIDAMQSVMSASTKVMVDVEGGNNMMYLPLDQLRNNSGAVNTTNQGPAQLNLTPGDVQRIRDAVISQLRNDQQSSNSSSRLGRREGR